MSSHTRDVAGQPEEPAAPATARASRAETQSDRDQVRELIEALGDPTHPRHSVAVDELVKLGPQAVPALTAALTPDHPWLTSYRAAEALAQIGDGRANGALIQALRHPNSNVRWSVVRALSEVGDTRAMIALRRVAHEDHGKTSWGESVADSAQVALDRLHSRSALLRFSEPIKTALVFIVMLIVVAFAASRVQALRDDLSRRVPAPTVVAASSGADEAGAPGDEQGADVVEATPTPAETPTPSIVATPEISGRVNTNANVRSGPGTQYEPIASARQGEQVVLLAESGAWYQVRLPDGREGYIAKSLIDAPEASLPPVSATATP